jgi:hypothetical protein
MYAMYCPPAVFAILCHVCQLYIARGHLCLVVASTLGGGDSSGTPPDITWVTDEHVKRVCETLASELSNVR